ncbi:ZC3H6 [Symbiodinium sp. CCMP2456]|nr:ZC3H6 [Symbiodinium sp. CCMP2456]
MGGSKKTTAAERQAKLLEEAKGEVNRRACLHRQLHKTKFCTYFLKGACHYGPQCAFAHSCTELQAMPDLRKTRMCKAFAEGKCTDPNCAFAHGEQELVSTGLFHKMSLCKWNEKGKCRNGSQCRFAHGLEELRDMKKAVTAAAAFAPPDVSASGALEYSVSIQVTSLKELGEDIRDTGFPLSRDFVGQIPNHWDGRDGLIKLSLLGTLDRIFPLLGTLDRIFPLKSERCKFYLLCVCVCDRCLQNPSRSRRRSR